MIFIQWCQVSIRALTKKLSGFQSKIFAIDLYLVMYEILCYQDNFH